MFKPSRRAAVVAASFAFGLSCVGPYAHAGLLGGDSESSAVEGLPLPLAGDLLGGSGLLGEDGVLGLLGGDLLGGDLLGGGLPVVGPLLGDGLLGGGLPVVGPLLGGDDSVLAGERSLGALGGLGGVGALVPGAGSVLGVLTAASGSDSLVPGVPVQNDLGLLGLLGSL